MLLLLLSKFYQKFVADMVYFDILMRILDVVADIIKNGLEEKIVADVKSV